MKTGPGDAAERYPDAYIEYLVQFQAVRDYFECHEILEDYWKKHPDSPYKETWVMLIQLAVGLYHQRRGNMRGAFKLLTGAIRRFNAGHLSELGIDHAELRKRICDRILEITEQRAQPFTDLDIPLSDRELEERCRMEAAVKGKRWGQPSDMADEQLLNRHLLRDRDAVRRQRLAALELTALRTNVKRDRRPMN